MAQAKYGKWLEKNNLMLLQAWARDGLTDKQIASNMGIATSTLYEWKKQHSDISEALKMGKEVADIAVENAMYKRAVGFYASDEQTTTKMNAKGEVETTTVRSKRYVPPDVAAIIFWLKNRKPETWRDKPDIYGIDKKAALLEIDKAQALLDKTKAEIEKLKGTKGADDKVMIVDDVY